MSKLPLMIILGLVLVRCGDQAKDLCSRLTDKCSANAGNTCRDNTHNEEQQFANCSELIQAFSDCVAALTLTCSSDTEITVTNPRDIGNEPSPTNDTHIRSQHFVVKDSTCTLIKNGLDACRTCPTAAGAQEVAVHGVGEQCTGDSDCAHGLTCMTGICSRNCTDATDCYARAEGCQLSATQTTICDTSRPKPVCAVTAAN